jgi:hypothetical protein
MHRCSSGFFLILAVTFLVALTGCLGKSSSNPGNGGLSSITITPSGTASLDVGSSVVFSATGRNASGQPVLGLDIRFIVQSGDPNASAPLSIAGNGNACAGTWDVSIADCSPGTPGIAFVTAVTNGVSSPVTTVYVHQHVDSIKITNAEAQPPLHDCFSQGQTWQYSGVAFSNNVDITSSVGPMTWSSSNTGVVTTTPIVTGTAQNPVYQVQTTAKAPGITQLFASVSGTTSNPLPYTTCLIQAIYLQIGGQNQGGNSITVNTGGSVNIKAIAIDTLYNIANITPLAAPPLTWSTTNPEVAAFNTTTNTTGSNNATARSNLGGATLTASCGPPSCNIGVIPSLPIYASDCNATDVPTPCPLPGGTKGYGAISVDVTLGTGAKPPTYTAWAATTECENLPGCSSALFSVTSGTTPIGPILGLPRTPNSMVFNHLAASRLYLGSDQGLMFVDVGGTSPSVSLVSSTSTPCNLALCGKVLTISNDGNQVVVADTVSTPSQVYIYNASTSNVAPIDLIIPGEIATAAAFSPDQLKLFILTNTGRMYVYSTSDALTSVPIANSVTDVKFSADGSFAYVAGNPGTTSVSGYAACDTPATNVLSGITTKFPTLLSLALYPLPTQQLDSQGNWAQVVLALDPPNVDTFGVKVKQNPLPLDQFVCNPPTVSFDPDFPTTSTSLDLPNTPIYAQLVADGNELIIVAENVPAVLFFDVTNGTTSAVSLANSSTPLAASASTDGSEVFVAACDQYDQNTKPPTCAVGSIHIINTSSQNGLPLGDFQQVPYVNASNNNDRNMCNNGGNPVPQCLPNMVAIKPQ